MNKSICIFCGSSKGNNEVYAAVAKDLGKLMAEKQIDLVYGGGKVGLMGTIADAVLESGGKAYGVIPQHLVDKEVAHIGLTELFIVNTMHQRKEKMYDLSGAFIAMPGGFGTLDEFCEIITWSQLGFHQKPMAFLNTAGYFDHLLKHFSYSVEAGFVRKDHFHQIQVESNPHKLLNQIVDRISTGESGDIDKA